MQQQFLPLKNFLDLRLLNRLPALSFLVGDERFRWSRFLPSTEVLLDGLVDDRFLW